MLFPLFGLSILFPISIIVVIVIVLRRHVVSTIVTISTSLPFSTFSPSNLHIGLIRKMAKRSGKIVQVTEMLDPCSFADADVHFFGPLQTGDSSI